jgi:hypothetical protein
MVILVALNITGTKERTSRVNALLVGLVNGF